MTTYVTFGQTHVHSVNGKTFDKYCVAAIPSENAQQGREKAFEIFGRKFCFEYFEDQFDRIDLDYFPRGIIQIGN